MTSSVSGGRRRHADEAEERHVTGVAGKSVVLRCDLPTSSPPSVRWIDYVYNTSPEPELISAAHQVQRTHPKADKFRVDSEFSLTISSLQVDESPGEYVCRSDVDGRTHELVYQLTVCSMLHVLSCFYCVCFIHVLIFSYLSVLMCLNVFTVYRLTCFLIKGHLLTYLIFMGLPL